MAKVSNPESNDRGIKFQFDGRLGVLPIGITDWDLKTAKFLQKKFGGRGVRIIPSAEELALEKAVADEMKKGRPTRAEVLAKRKATEEAREKASAMQPAPLLIVSGPAVEPEPEIAVDTVSVVEPEVVVAPAPESGEEKAQVVAPPDGSGDV